MFAWTPADMPGIDPNIICHKLAINPSVRPIAQKKRRFGTDKRAASLEETTKLLSAGFIRELRYSTWLANVVMVKKNNETGKQQHPVYFVSKSLQNAEVRYLKLEKLALALVITARRMRHYFQSHTIVVRTEQPLRQILMKPELAGRLIKWSIELSEYDIQYQSKGAIKSQALADFIAELTLDEQDPKNSIWTLYVDSTSNNKGSGAGILLENEHGATLEQSLQFTFHASNNQAEYEALIAGLGLAHTMGITQLNVKCDSLLVVQQVTGNFQVKDPLLEKYNTIVNNLVNNFQKFNISHIPREKNDRADILSKLATTRSQNTIPVLSQLMLEEPSVMPISSVSQEDDWRSPFITYLQTAEAANKIILQSLKKKLEDSKGEWAELTPEVLWSYNTTEQSSIRETPFRLVYGCNAMMPIEVSLQNTRTTNISEKDNIENRKAELDLVEEDRDKSALHQLAAKRAITRKYNKKLKPRTFLAGDLVLRKVEVIRKPQGHCKLSTNWEGPFPNPTSYR
ncbi:uncharacterized protein [Arachis hypogaea]|uniref:uncharacterized protein n=1 Tax=Arachis hypogaea TaxID=3818 RepID=UPI003B21C679